MTEQEMRERLDNGLCIKCGNPINKNHKYFCEDCYENSTRKVIESGLNGNDWVWWVVLLGVFSGKGEEFSTERLKEIFCKDENNNN